MSRILITVISKSERARAWVNHYAATGAAALVGVTVASGGGFPGQMFAIVREMTKLMCYEIGKIYRGNDYSLEEAAEVASSLSLTIITTELAAMEVVNFIPFAGFVFESSAIVGIIQEIGALIIAYYERSDI